MEVAKRGGEGSEPESRCSQRLVSSLKRDGSCWTQKKYFFIPLVKEDISPLCIFYLYIYAYVHIDKRVSVFTMYLSIDLHKHKVISLVNVNLDLLQSLSHFINTFLLSMLMYPAVMICGTGRLCYLAELSSLCQKKQGRFTFGELHMPASPSALLTEIAHC